MMNCTKNLVFEIGKLLFQYISLKYISEHSFVLEFKLYHAHHSDAV